MGAGGLQVVWPGALMCCSFLIPDDIAKTPDPLPEVLDCTSEQGPDGCLRSTYHVSNRGY